MKRRNSAGALMVTLLIPVAIAINMVGGQMTSVLSLPIALDMIGVLLVGALAGTVPAVITAVLTNLLNGMLDPSWIPYVICSFFIGLTIGLLAKCNMMNRIWKAAISGVLIALVATVTSTFVTVFFFGGISGGGSAMIIAGLLATGQQLVQSVFSVYIVTELVGKLISTFVAYFIIKAISDRTLLKFPYGSKYIVRKTG